jgi:hypothetical protein
MRSHVPRVRNRPKPYIGISTGIRPVTSSFMFKEIEFEKYTDGSWDCAGGELAHVVPALVNFRLRRLRSSIDLRDGVYYLQNA